MLSESPSDKTRVQPSSTTRVYFNEASQCDEETDKAIPPTGKTALEAAMAAANTYVETLHKKLQPFLTDLIRQVIVDASHSHFRSEKFKEMNATPEYVPTICRTVGLKLQAVSEVTESSGFKALNDELTGEIEAIRRDWAKRFVFPAYDMNVKALQKRFQLSFCRLLSSAAKGFIAQVGIEGYEAIVAVMDLLALHSNEVLKTLNVNTHEFLVLLKEATGKTIIPSPTVEHSLSEALNKINGTSSSEDRGQEDGSSTTLNTAHAVSAATININVHEQLNEAESAVAQATSQLELMRGLADQARAAADEASRARTTAHESLAAARREQREAIDNIDIATADERLCVAELAAVDMDKIAASKRQLTLGAQALFESATSTHADAVNALNALCGRSINDAESIIRTRGTITPRSMSSLSTAATPIAGIATALMTPRSIIHTPTLHLPNPYRLAASLLYEEETNTAIQDIVVTATSKDTPSDAPSVTTPAIEGRKTVISALKTLLDNGIVKSLHTFYARTAKHEQNRRITKATVEPQLEQAAARIAAVVEAERPISHSTIKGLIHVDVDKSTDELRRRIQSLEAKLGETKIMLKRKATTLGDTAILQKKMAKNAEGDGKMSNKTPGTAVAHSTVIPNKNKTWKRTATTPTPTQKNWSNNTGNGKKPWNNPTGNGKPWGKTAGNGKKPWGNPAGNGKKPWGTPAGNGGASTNTNKPGKGATGRKPGGRKDGRQTVANN